MFDMFCHDHQVRHRFERFQMTETNMGKGHQPKTLEDNGHQPKTLEDNGHQPKTLEDNGHWIETNNDKPQHQPKTLEDNAPQPDTIKDEEIEECKRMFNDQLDWYWKIKPDIISLKKEPTSNTAVNENGSETVTKSVEKYFRTIKIAIRHGLIAKYQIIDIKRHILPNDTFTGYEIENIKIFHDFTERLAVHIKKMKHSKRIKAMVHTTIQHDREKFIPYEYYSDFSSLPINYTSFHIRMPPLFNFGSVFLMSMPLVANGIFVVKKFIKNRKGSYFTGTFYNQNKQ